MPSYRIYHVGSGGRLRVGATLVAEDDREAVAKAKLQLSSGQGAELWEWGRLVGRFGTDHEFAAGSG